MLQTCIEATKIMALLLCLVATYAAVQDEPAHAAIVFAATK